ERGDAAGRGGQPVRARRGDPHRPAVGRQGAGRGERRTGVASIEDGRPAGARGGAGRGERRTGVASIEDERPHGGAILRSRPMAGAKPTTPRSRQARLASVLEGTGLGAGLRRIGGWRGVLVLTYHRIGDARSSSLDRGLFSAGAEAFERHVAPLAREADVIRLEDVPSALRARRGRQVLITFDDGYRDAYDVAFPVLRRGVPPA